MTDREIPKGDRPEAEPFMVKIRVKERIGRHEAAAKFGSPEKVLLVILGACLGLGLGYLAAGMLVRYLSPPIRTIRAGAPAIDLPQTQATSSPAAVDIEFDLPSQGN